MGQNSPRNTNVAIPTTTNLMTSSSLFGEYQPLCVQVSKDLVPIISEAVKIPDQVFSLGIADVTYEQVLQLNGNKTFGMIRMESSSVRGYAFPPFVTLEETLKVK
jgi:hypothetical protein